MINFLVPWHSSFCSPLLLFISYTVGRLVTGLVREFLEYFELDFTIAVFDPETNFVSHAL